MEVIFLLVELEIGNMNKIYEAGDIPLDDKVYLKKDLFGWRVVNPAINPSTKKINWINMILGGWRNFLVILFIVLIILLHLHEDAKNFNERDRLCTYTLTNGQSNEPMIMYGSNWSSNNLSLIFNNEE